LAHGVRNPAAGLRYVLYMCMTDLHHIAKVTHSLGDVSNVTFSNGWIAEDDGTVFIYYASSDLRMHVAISSIEKLLDYVISTPEDGFTSKASVKTIMKIIEQNDSTEGRDGEEPTKNYVLVRS
jgi:4-O-beta-D-mannosyl-D-glucose phosphorylase